MPWSFVKLDGETLEGARQRSPAARGDALIELTRQQNDVFHSTQAFNLGFTERMISSRIRRGDFVMVQPRVYRYQAARLSWRGAVTAGVLSTGGVASHATAARLLGISDMRRDPVPELLVPRGRLIRRDNIRVRETNQWSRIDEMWSGGIPHTGVERTLIDAGDSMNLRRLLGMVDAAILKNLTTWEALRHKLDRDARYGRNGCGSLRLLLDQHGDDGVRVPHSEWSRWFADDLVQCGLPAPELEVRFHRPNGSIIAQVDLAYTAFDIDVLIELDSEEHHLNRESFHNDPRKRTELAAKGKIVLTFTWRAWKDDHFGCMEQVRGALISAGWSPTATRLPESQI